MQPHNPNNSYTSPSQANSVSQNSHRKRGVTTSSFLKNLENTPEARERMFLEESLVDNEEESHLARMLSTKLNITRKEIQSYNILQDKPKEDTDFSALPRSLNLMVFGPSGSGKSSLVRTLYTSLNNEFSLPPELASSVVIKGLSSNEGTVNFTKVILKEESNNVVKSGQATFEYNSSGICVYDTRGQIKLDSKEKEAVNLMVEGKVREGAKIENRTFRYAYLLFEFWKKDSELFVEDTFSQEGAKGLKNRPHCLLFVFDGSLEEVPNGEEETAFYRNIIHRCRSRKYFYPQVVLTRVDKLEEKVNSMIVRGKIQPNQKEKVLREMQDVMIENVVQKLGIPRSSVHFIENYHSKHQASSIMIDYYAIKLLQECIVQGDDFIDQNSKKSMCKLI